MRSNQAQKLRHMRGKFAIISVALINYAIFFNFPVHKDKFHGYSRCYCLLASLTSMIAARVTSCFDFFCVHFRQYLRIRCRSPVQKLYNSRDYFLCVHASVNHQRSPRRLLSGFFAFTFPSK